MDIAMYLASRTPAEARKIKAKARIGVHHGRTVGSSICPPRDIMATQRYKLPTRSEIFGWSQMTDPDARLAETSGRIGATLFHSPGQSRPTMGNNGDRYVNGR